MKNIDGVKIIDVKMHKDARGSYNEIFRENWHYSPQPVQWSVTQSVKGAIRGMRYHLEHTDYVCLCHGKAVYIMKDLRKNSATFKMNQYVQLNSKKLQIIITPPGVAHGFYFYEYSIFVVGISHYYNPADELGFYYKDKDAGIKWPKGKTIVTTRDKNLPSLKDILKL